MTPRPACPGTGQLPRRPTSQEDRLKRNMGQVQCAVCLQWFLPKTNGKPKYHKVQA